jgi:hypothetical protein
VLPHRERGGLGGFSRRSLADELLARVPDIEVHLVAAPPAEARERERSRD